MNLPLAALHQSSRWSPRNARRDLQLGHWGLDTGDLKDAKALLEELGSHRSSTSW